MGDENDVPQGGDRTFTGFEFREYDGGPLTDDDRYDGGTTYWPAISVVNPAGNSGPAPTAEVTARQGAGVYSLKIMTSTGTLLTSALPSGQKYLARFVLQINGAARTFEWEFEVVSTGSFGQGAGYYGSRTRMRRRLKLESEEVVVCKTGGSPAPGATALLLVGRFAAVASVLKNGVALATNAFSFKRPNAFTFTAALADGDVLLLTMQKGATDDDLDDMLLQAHSYVINALKRCGSPSLASADVSDLGRYETDLACAIWKEDQQEATGDKPAQYTTAASTDGKTIVVPGRFRARAQKAIEEFLEARFPESYYAPGQAPKASRMHFGVGVLEGPWE